MTETILLQECPACGYQMDRASGVNTEAKPSCGDLTVCIDCGAICEFGRDLEMVLVAPELLPGADYSDAREVQRKVRALRGWDTK